MHLIVSWQTELTNILDISHLLLSVQSTSFRNLISSSGRITKPNLLGPLCVKVKVKCALVQALRLCTGRTAHRGCRSIALLFLDHGTRRGEGLASRSGSFIPPGKKRYPLYRRLGGPQRRSGQVRKISPPHRDSIPGPSSP